MPFANWPRYVRVGTMVSMLALGGCAIDPITGAVPSDPSLPPDQQPIATAERLTRLGDAAMGAGDPRTAIGFYRRAWALDSRHFPVLIRLAGALNSVGAHAEAAEVYRKALLNSPRDPEALRGLGNALVAQNEPLLAREQFQTALEVSSDPRLYSAIAITLDLTGDHRMAQGYYQTALDLDPANLTVINNLGLSLTLSGDHGEAIELLRTAASDPKAGARHRHNLALAYAMAGRTDEARRVAAQDFDPAGVEQAIAFYEALRAMPDKAKYLLAPNQRHFAMNRPPEAEPAATSALPDPKPAVPAGSLAAAPLPAPEIDAAALDDAMTPAALPPIEGGIDAPLRAWDVDELVASEIAERL